jgi:hypothetical protein
VQPPEGGCDPGDYQAGFGAIPDFKELLFAHASNKYHQLVLWKLSFST